MLKASRVRRGDVTLAAVALAVATTLSPRSVHAGNEPVDACIASYERYENRLAAGDLLEAKKGLAQCGASNCPGALQRECVGALAALEPRVPTVVLVARDPAKRDLTDVRVSLDGVPLRAKLDGREVEVNPGPHRFRFETAGADPVEQSVVIHEREKGRFVEAQLVPRGVLAPSPAERDREKEKEKDVEVTSSRPVPALSWVLGGVGVIGLGTSAFFGATALAARSDANQCKPNCAPHQVDIVNQRLLGADIALGVSLVSLAAAVVVYLAQPTESHKPESARR